MDSDPDHSMAPSLAAPARLERALRDAMGEPVLLEVTRNRSRMLSAKRDRRGTWIVRVHQMFLDAPDDIVAALAGWLDNDQEARGRLRDYIRDVRENTLEESASPADPLADDVEAGTAGPAPDKGVARAYGPETRGRHHDLGVYARRLNELYLDGRSKVPVEWSVRRPKAGGRSVRLGYYDPSGRRIVISRHLDRAEVPSYFVEYVLFHEMLHEVLGIGRRPDGRRDIHGRLFRLMERTYPDYERALAYERKVWGGK